MFRLHLDHRIQSSRIVTDMLSFDRDLRFEYPSLRVAYWFRSTQFELSLTVCQHIKRRVRAKQIVPDCEVIETDLDDRQIRRYA